MILLWVRVVSPITDGTVTDLYLEFRILCHIYESYRERKFAYYDSLKQEEDLSYIPEAQLITELNYLTERRYINSPAIGALTLSANGQPRLLERDFWVSSVAEKARIVTTVGELASFLELG